MGMGVFPAVLPAAELDLKSHMSNHQQVCMARMTESFLHDVFPNTFHARSTLQVFTYIYHKNQPNVGKYTIHGCYGLVGWCRLQICHALKRTLQHPKCQVRRQATLVFLPTSWHMFQVKLPTNDCVSNYSLCARIDQHHVKWCINISRTQSTASMKLKKRLWPLHLPLNGGIHIREWCLEFGDQESVLTLSLQLTYMHD